MPVIGTDMDAALPDGTAPAAASGGRVAVDARLLEVLVCPLTKGPLTYDRAADELVSRAAGLAYPIRDGIPIMLVEEARRLDQP
jgi:uncharacterized protein YbaR (Trm112 family)